MLDGLVSRARAELEAAAARAAATLQRVGDPRLLAGDPASLLRAAQAERRRAAELRGTAAVLDGRLRTVVPSRWDGRDSEACGGAWELLRAEAEACAAARDGVAATLESAAASAATLNDRATEAVAAVGGAVEEARRRLRDPSWLDAAALAALLQRLLLMLRTLEQSVEDGERFVAGLALRLPEPETHVRIQVGVVPLIGPWPLPGVRLGLAPGRTAVLPRVGVGTGGARGGGAGLVILAGLGAVFALLAALASEQGGGGGGDTTGGGGSTSVAGAPQPRPPEEPPRKPDGEIDWAAWRARLASKGIRGDLDARINRAMTATGSDRTSAVAELQAAERYADAGYRVDLIEADNRPDVPGIRYPDMTVRAPGSDAPIHVEVKSATQPISMDRLGSTFRSANAQIKGAEGSAQSAQQTGDIVYDGSSAPGQGLDQSGVEQFLRKGVTETQFRQVRYAEVIYRDGGILKRSFIIRNPDGSVGPVMTQLLS